MKDEFREILLCLGILCLSLGCTALPALSAPKSDLWSFWASNSPESTVSPAHGVWDALLKRYVDSDHPSGINRFRYPSVSEADRQALGGYLKDLQQKKVSRLNRREQKAFWINLYNAMTVYVVLDHYPVKTIRDIDLSPGWFSNGPWDAKLLRIEDKEVSLNDIEHRILRPLWKDNRVHYALNCASLGCPNLLPMAFTSENSEKLLEIAPRQFINHPRGVKIEQGLIQVSSIYKWFQVDFGGSEKKVIQHLLQYAEKGLAQNLTDYHDRLRYDYDWRLNE